MDQVKLKRLFESIKQDDLILFSTLIEGNENICYGRFPILSLCYLYNAKKIIKKHKSKFYKIEEYKRTTEYIEIYQKFRSFAGRTLRLYTSGALVTPLEMLAILSKDYSVKKEYNKFYRDRKIEKSLESIYLIHGQNVSVEMYKIKIERKTLTCYQKVPYKIALIVCISFMVVIASLYTLCNYTTGSGTTFRTFNIASGSQFVSALKLKGEYQLNSDITIDKTFDPSDFNSNIDGNNHTVYINFIPSTSLIKNNYGNIKNINFVYKDIDTTINNDLSLLVNKNYGLIQGVNIKCQKLNINCQKIENKDLYISGFAIENLKTIENCKIELNANITGSLNGNCSVSGFVGINNGTIKNCEYKEGSIETNEVDVSGIVCVNNKLASVLNCKNNANISQTSEQDGWSPNVSGIVMTNNGSVENCCNYGNLKVVSNNETEDSGAVVFLGGITANNYGLTSKCLNYGNLEVKSKMIIVYCGGISGYSNYATEGNTTYLPVISNCGSECVIDVLNEYEKGFVFVGGISGYLYGKITNNFSITEFVNGYNETKDFVGSCVGAGYLEYQLFSSVICITASNNYTLAQDNVDFQIGSLINTNTIVSAGLNDSGTGIITFADIEEIKKQEVYFSEKQ